LFEDIAIQTQTLFAYARGGQMKNKSYGVYIFLVLTIIAAPLAAQQANQNINVLPVIPQQDASDDEWFKLGDGFLQRQVEPTIAVSTRNPDHLLAFFNDYRAVDIPNDEGLGEQNQNLALVLNTVDFMMAGLIAIPDLPFIQPPPMAAAEAWVGGSRSYDGGLTWSGFFMPGAPFDFSPASTASPVYGLEAATDPVAVAGPCGYVYVVFMGFTRGDQSKMVVARFQDLNNQEGGDTWEYQGTSVLEIGNNATNGYFLDKPHIALDSAHIASMPVTAPSTGTMPTATSAARSTSPPPRISARPGLSPRSSSPITRTRAPSSLSIREPAAPRPQAVAPFIWSGDTSGNRTRSSWSRPKISARSGASRWS
jgi:hypothetical protein